MDDVCITASAATTAGVIRMFVSDGTLIYLHSEFLVTAVTPSTSVGVWSIQLTNLGIILKSGWSLRFGTNNAELFKVIMTRGGDL